MMDSWKLHIFQLKGDFCENVDQNKKIFYFWDIVSPKNPQKNPCVNEFQKFYQIVLSSMYLLYTIGCLLRVN